MNKPNSNGYDALLIHQRKGLNKNQQILDNMGSTELALFRAMEGEEKLRREEIQGKNKAHLEVGKKVRQTIEVLGGAMAEDLTMLVEGLVGLGETDEEVGREWK